MSHWARDYHGTRLSPSTMSRISGSRAIRPSILHDRPAGFVEKTLDGPLELSFTNTPGIAQGHYGRIISNAAKPYITIGVMSQILLEPGQPRT